MTWALWFIAGPFVVIRIVIFVVKFAFSKTRDGWHDEMDEINAQFKKRKKKSEE